MLNTLPWPYLVLSLLTGGLLGALFWGGLWWTVQKIAVSSRPYLLSLASFVVRTAAVMAGFYIALGAGWHHLLVSLIGFLLVRIVLTRRLRPEQGA